MQLTWLWARNAFELGLGFEIVPREGDSDLRKSKIQHRENCSFQRTKISRFSRRRIHILWIREIYARKFSAMKSVPAAHVSEPTRANCTNLRLFTSAGHWGVPQSHHQGDPTPPPPNELCISRDAFDSSPFLLPFARSQSTRKNTTNARTTFASRHHEIVLQRNSKEIRNFIYICIFLYNTFLTLSLSLLLNLF